MYDSQPVTTVVPNRLSSVRDLLHEKLRAWLPKFCVAVSKCDGRGSGMPATIVSVHMSQLVFKLPLDKLLSRGFGMRHKFGINIMFASKLPSLFCWGCCWSNRRVRVAYLFLPSDNPSIQGRTRGQSGLSFPTQSNILLSCTARRVQPFLSLADSRQGSLTHAWR